MVQVAQVNVQYRFRCWWQAHVAVIKRQLRDWTKFMRPAVCISIRQIWLVAKLDPVHFLRSNR